jgi:ATP-dependent Clp protease ATP-binding subunit ClpC
LGYSIEISPEAKDYIAEKGWDAQFGARPLKRAIQKYIEDALAEEIIKTKIKPNDLILVGYNTDKEEITIDITTPSKKLEKTPEKPSESESV